jgi:hypothetical protein
MPQYKKRVRPSSALLKTAFFVRLSSYELNSRESECRNGVALVKSFLSDFAGRAGMKTGRKYND